MVSKKAEQVPNYDVYPVFQTGNTTVGVGGNTYYGSFAAGGGKTSSSAGIYMPTTTSSATYTSASNILNTSTK